MQTSLSSPFLINIKNMFTEHLSDESRPYRLNFIMDKAKGDLNDLIGRLESKEMEL